MRRPHIQAFPQVQLSQELTAAADPSLLTGSTAGRGGDESLQISHGEEPHPSILGACFTCNSSRPHLPREALTSCIAFDQSRRLQISAQSGPVFHVKRTV